MGKGIDWQRDDPRKPTVVREIPLYLPTGGSVLGLQPSFDTQPQAEDVSHTGYLSAVIALLSGYKSI